jgi:hypothetical protein
LLPPSVGDNITRQADKAEASDLFKYKPLATSKPDIWENLLRFGLASMAAGGKPGATTLGALGEGGLAAFAAHQKAAQSDIENELANRKVGLQGQDQIRKMRERLDTLNAALANHQLASADRLRLAQERNDLMLFLGQGRLDATAQGQAQTAAHQSMMETIAQQGADARTAAQQALQTNQEQQRREAETRQQQAIQKSADDARAREEDRLNKLYPMASLDTKGGGAASIQAMAIGTAARLHPTSSYVGEWGNILGLPPGSSHADAIAKETELRKNAQNFVKDHPDKKADANQKLMSYGIRPIQ